MAGPSDNFLKKFSDFNKVSAACLTGDAEAVEAALNESYATQAEPNQEEQINTDRFTDEIGWTPLHYSCQRGKSPQVAELLLTRGFSCLAKNIDGNTPLHIACINNNLEVVNVLLGSLDYQKCLELKNKEGNTPLHIACHEGSMKIAKALLGKCFHRDHAHMCVCRHTNEQNVSPIGTAIQQSHYNIAQLILRHSPGNPAVMYPDLTSHIPACTHIKTTSAMECDPLEVFIMGDKGSGKSSLIKTLHSHSESFLSRLYTMIPYVRISTDDSKMGVVSTSVQYKRGSHTCSVIFHELAGSCNYTHEALKLCTQRPLDATYLVTVDLREGQVCVKEKLLFWLSYLHHKLSQVCVNNISPTHSLTAKLKLLVIGTFYDQTTVRDRAHHMLNYICTSISKENEDLLKHFAWLGNYTFNTRKAYSWGIAQLRQVFQGQCQQLHQETPSSLIPSQSYLLANLLLAEFQSSVVVSLAKVVEHLEKSDDVMCKLLLTNTSDEIIDLCHELKHFPQFKVIEKARDTKKIFIICNSSQLSSDIHDVFEELEHLHGIVRTDILSGKFESMPYEYPIGFITHYLESFSLCKPVAATNSRPLRRSFRLSQRSLSESPLPPTRFKGCRRTKSLDPKEVEEMTRPRTSSDVDLNQPRMMIRSARRLPYYFIPSLLPSQPQYTNWNANGDKYSYGFAWSLVVRDNQECQFFTPLIQTTLLFQLLYDFTPQRQDASTPLDRQCDLWESGISWSTHGVRACVVMHDYKSITLSMQCLENQEITCLQLRNQIINFIHKLKTEHRPDIETDELLIPYDKATPFPISDPTTTHCFTKTEIQNAVEERRDVVMCTEGKEQVTLEQILFFEPLCFLTPTLHDELFNSKNARDKISEDFCMEFAKELGEKWKTLALHFELHKSKISDLQLEQVNRTPHNVAFLMLREVKDVITDGLQTYQELKESLLDISIFREDEIVSRSNVSPGNETDVILFNS